MRCSWHLLLLNLPVADLVCHRARQETSLNMKNNVELDKTNGQVLLCVAHFVRVLPVCGLLQRSLFSAVVAIAPSCCFPIPL